MKQSRWMTGAALVSLCLITPAARAENVPPAPPPGSPAAPASPFPGFQPPGGAVPRSPAPGAPAPGTVPGAIPPGSQPGTTRAGTAAPARPVPLPGYMSVMVFPFDNNTPYGGPALGQALADAVERGMDASHAYTTAKYSPESLLVQRAMAENPNVMGPLTRGVIDPARGTVDQAAALQIALRTGMEAVLLGSIEEYTYDKAANKVTMVATAQILNTQNGEPLRTAGVTGTATGAAGTDESTVAQAAATDVASRLLAGLAVPPPVVPQHKAKHAQKPPPTQAQEGSRHHIPGWIPAGVLLGIIVGAVR